MHNPGATQRVLIVDDEPQVRNALARLLRARGIETMVAATGEEALALAQGATLQVVVTDLNMPGMGGVVMLQRLSPLQPSARLVVLTGAGPVDTELLPRGHQVRVIHKPWSSSDVLTAILGKRPSSSSTLPPAPAKIKKTQVLLVETKSADALFAKTALMLNTDEQYCITQATTLKGARHQLEEKEFDVACVELDLPDAQGLEAFLKIQASAPGLGIVVLSRLDDEALALRAVQAGAQDFLVKEKTDGPTIIKAIRYAQERKRAEHRLSEMAFHDQLTGLANRTLFRQRIAQALSRARDNSTSFVVLLLNMDRFKAINDALGHDAGDAFLQKMAKRLRQATRDSETVARLSGDEFAVLAEGIDQDNNLEILCNRILDRLREPLEINNTRLRPTASIGAAIFPVSGQDSDTLLAAAGEAMYVAKNKGRNSYHVHGIELSETSARRVELERKLSIAVENKDFQVHYQPQVNNSGAWVGAEALLRWPQKTASPIYPDQFVPLLEETGLIHEIGPWLINEACSQLRKWQDSGCGVERIGINISATQFTAGDVVEDIRRATRDAGLDPASVELEITESALIHDTESIRDKLAALASDGHRLALDDFGTGYCSLAYLRHFPINTVKIDKSFTQEIATDAYLRELVGGIIHLAGRLKLDVIAEGIETEEQLRVLQQQGCSTMQGYLFGKALPADDFSQRFRRTTERVRVCPAAEVEQQKTAKRNVL